MKNTSALVLTRVFTLVLLLCGMAFFTTASAEEPSQGLSLFDDLGLGGQDEILPVDEAFQLSTKTTENSFIVRFTIAEGTYLYRDKIQISVDDATIKTYPLQLPEGDLKEDKVLGETLYVYHNDTEVKLPFSHTLTGDKIVTFKVSYLGCSETAGICYPPQNKTFKTRLSSASTTTPDTAIDEPVISEQDELVQALRSEETLYTLLLFYIGGLLLAFTPCVLPMVPILSGIIVGQGENTTTRQALGLSVVYVLAMAITYTIVGILVGLSGENIQAWFQDPWIIGFFASIIVILSLSMFGFYELQMPASIQSKLAAISNSQKGGTIIGVAIMGFLSALIVGPCVTAPLVAALIYIAEEGDAVLGGMALFSLSMGMGTPLLLIGASAGKFLPKAGTWMDSVKSIFGVLLLGLAIWLLERVTPAAITMLLWAALLIISAMYMGAMSTLPVNSSGWQKLWKGLGILMMVYGILIVIGASSGNRSIFQPLKGLSFSSQSSGQSSNQADSTQHESHLAFRQIKGIDGLNIALSEAKANAQPVMLDFYADWCISCKEMEALTFSDASVQQSLKGVMLLQADVTPNDELDRALYKHFGIIGPPSIMFFNRDGDELKNYRVVGFMNAEKFNQHIKRALK